MKSKYIGHDPELGKKFLSEYSGSVIVFGRSSRSESEPHQFRDLQEQFNEDAERRALSRSATSLSEQDHQLKLMGKVDEALIRMLSASEASTSDNAQ